MQVEVRCGACAGVWVGPVDGVQLHEPSGRAVCPRCGGLDTFAQPPAADRPGGGVR